MPPLVEGSTSLAVMEDVQGVMEVQPGAVPPNLPAPLRRRLAAAADTLHSLNLTFRAVVEVQGWANTGGRPLCQGGRDLPERSIRDHHGR